jgi:DNA-binding transcriptional MerR regulator
MNLEDLALDDHEWLLDEFVDICNHFLPIYLPDTTRSNLKVKEEVNSRLVRHYTSQRLLDEPLRYGKYAVYTYRHLLQFLVVRRLLSQGIGAIAIDDLITSKSNEELNSLLMGGIQLQVTTAHPSLSNKNSALDYLDSLKKGQINNHQITKDKLLNFKGEVDQNWLNQFPQENINSLEKQETNWTRIEILDGLEINLRSDFIYPNSVSEQENFKKFMLQKLTDLLKRKKL